MTVPYTGPRVGVGVFALDQQNRIVMAERYAEFGRGTLCLPGGKVERFDTILKTARDELFQETGLYCPRLRVIGAMDEIDREKDEHWITVYTAGHVLEPGALQRREPDKHGEWDWYPLYDLPDTTWPTITEFLGSNQGRMFRDNWLGRLVWNFRGIVEDPNA